MEEERWVPVIVKHFGEKFERDVYNTYEVSDRCRVRNKVTGKGLSGKGKQVGLRGGGEPKMMRRHIVTLMSFFPDRIPSDINNYNVVRIDFGGDFVLENLRWMTKSEHSTMTQTRTKGNRKSQVENKGKMVEIIAAKNDTIIGPSMVGRTFGSGTCAGRVLGLRQNVVSRSILKGYWAGHYRFEYMEQLLLPGEVFVPWHDYEVSNKGRYKHKNGKISKGVENKGTIYRTVQVTVDGVRKAILMHNLIWEAFEGEIPEGMIVMHDDTRHTLDERGYERNYLEDLTLGTQSQNMQSYNDNRTDLKRVRCVDDGKEFRCAMDTGKYYGISPRNIRRVCNKKRKTAGGLRFEYV